MARYLKPDFFVTAREKLASLFLDKNQSRNICKIAGLDLVKINWEGIPLDRWDSILSQAEEENKVIELMIRADQQFGGNAALANYKTELETGAPFESTLQVGANGYKNNPPVMLIMYDKENAEVCAELKKQFRVFESDLKVIDFETDIHEGNRKKAEQELLQEADIIVPVISPDFFNPGNEYLLYLRSVIESEKKVVPVLLVRCLYSRVKILKDFITLPRYGKFISEYENQEEGFADVADGIAKLLPN